MVGLTFEPSQRFGMTFRENVITEVISGSQADTLNVKVGSIIVSVNGESQPRNAEFVLQAIKKTKDVNLPTTIIFRPEEFEKPSMKSFHFQTNMINSGKKMKTN